MNLQIMSAQKTIISAFIAFLLFGGFCVYGQSKDCGTERWDVKTLSDPAAQNIDFGHVINSTVASERALKVPVKPHSRTDQETVVIKVNATLTAVGLELDGDFHLVLSDKGKTIIAEIPNPDCPSINKKYADEYRKCRTWVTSKLQTYYLQSHPLSGEASDKQRDERLKKASAYSIVSHTFKKGLSIPVTIAGSRFFDKIHGQNGVAPNGVEVHPVIAIQ